MNKSVSAVLAVVLGLVLVACDSSVEQEAASSVSSEPVAATAQVSADSQAADLTQVVQTYCFVCHNDALMTGNLTMAGFEVENAQNHPETGGKNDSKIAGRHDAAAGHGKAEP